ncbi:MAG: hypothetical protein JSR46_09345, partial [Verrucomicrobia bacterium]|nr:hypothetical protein [Verrucomicrobiota bacterium]
MGSLKTQAISSSMPLQIETMQQPENKDPRGICSLFEAVIYPLKWSINCCFAHKKVCELDENPLGQKIEEILKPLPCTVILPEGSSEKLEKPPVLVLSSLKSLDEVQGPLLTLDYPTIADQIKSLEDSPRILLELDKAVAKEKDCILEFKSALEIADVDWLKQVLDKVIDAKLLIDVIWEKVVQEASDEDEHSDQCTLAKDIQERFSRLKKEGAGTDDYQLFKKSLNEITVENEIDQIVASCKAAVEISDLTWVKQQVTVATVSQHPIDEIWERVVDELRSE